MEKEGREEKKETEGKSLLVNILSQHQNSKLGPVLITDFQYTKRYRKDDKGKHGISSRILFTPSL